jgi:hypothetical protein
VAALQRHGLAAAVAEGLRRIGAAVRGTTILTKKERAAVVDADSGAQFGSEVEGSGGQVEMGPLLRAMRSDQRYACVHTHPEGFSFSAGDAAVLLSFPPLIAIAAVGSQSTWYILSLESGRDRQPGSDPGPQHLSRLPAHKQIWR